MKDSFNIIAGSVWEVLNTDITWEGIKVTAVISFTVACFFFTVALGWMLWYPYDPIRIDSLDVDITEAHVGDPICFKLVGEKFMPVPVHVIVELVNGEGVPITNYRSNVPVGTKFKGRCFNIPMHIRTNTYQVKWSGSYAINGLRNITKEVFSKPIHITNPLIKGIQGIQGIPGKPGKSTTIIFYGKGEKGDTGKQGERGFSGKNCYGANCN
jgi:hypothetical protein